MSQRYFNARNKICAPYLHRDLLPFEVSPFNS